MHRIGHKRHADAKATLSPISSPPGLCDQVGHVWDRVGRRPGAAITDAERGWPPALLRSASMLSCCVDFAALLSRFVMTRTRQGRRRSLERARFRPGPEFMAAGLDRYT
ncbi:hypothetical protein GCM10007067_25330 [Lysobacter bugurensis]|uniref:Uncharacterized protein n=1 Tax=Cognatilysobacter bugurensis TaxID=543356 RepID=A0A918T2W7_9GAMM|nr:hypothetical protein GCM10007067_25330 [Lysobacter bugurensis]